MFSILHLISWCVFGLVVGALARLLVPGKQPMGVLLTSALGIAGSFAGGLLWFVLGQAEFGATGGFVTSTLGAILILFLYPKLVSRA